MSASLAEVKGTLRELIEENAGIAPDSYGDDAAVDGELAMDSFSFVAVQVAVEETFDVQCSLEELEERGKFGAIAELIHERIQAKQ